MIHTMPPVYAKHTPPWSGVDKLMPEFQGPEPMFHKKYFNARIIMHLRGGPSMEQVTPDAKAA